MEVPSEEQIVAGRVARDAIKLGISLCGREITGVQLDKEIEQFIRDHNCFPALKGYKPPFSNRTYQHTICLSVNNQAVHGVPQDVVLTRDDLITIDLVVGNRGWFADTARTFTHSANLQKKMVAEKIAIIHTNSLSIISPNLPIEIYSEFCNKLASDVCDMTIINEFCGHGIGREIHEDPQIPSAPCGSKSVFATGKSYAVEPVIAVNKKYKLSQGDDGWAVLVDCLSAHMEDTIFVASVGIINLTA